MKTSTPKQKAPQPGQGKKAAALTYPATIERISLPDDLPPDNPRAVYRVTKPQGPR